jgi:hypothetical protein
MKEINTKKSLPRAKQAKQGILSSPSAAVYF